MGIDSFVKLMLHCNGDDESPIISDSSIANPKGNATVSGNAQIDTAQYVFGGASLSLVGTGNRISFVDSIDYYFGTGDFTIDFRIRWNDLTGAQTIITQFQNAGNQWYIIKNSNNTIQFVFTFESSIKGQYITASPLSLSADTWYHIEICRNNAGAILFLNGISQSLTETVAFGANDVGDINASLIIGADGNLTYYFNGWIDELRISKGIARHTENFTPPAEEYSPDNEITEIDTLTISDEIESKVSLEKLIFQDTIKLKDSTNLNTEEIENLDSFALLEDFEISFSLNKEDILITSDEIDIQLQQMEIYDIINDFRIAKQSLININNILASCRRILTNFINFISTAYQFTKNINNKFNSIKQSFYSIKNDIRTILTFQIPGEAGFQSLGKEYIKVYINDIEQTDANIDSISITKTPNAPATAHLELGRAYDSTRPDLQSTIKIKYHIWSLYDGYITQVLPTDNTESIRINCEDEYWKRNKTKYYFNIGYPSSDNELYYYYISGGLEALGASFGIGDFIPQTINLYGQGESDIISNLVSQSGNYFWYYDINKNKKLWIAGYGDIINLEPQEIGKNIGLYQVLNHSIKDNIENIVNRFLVRMGDITIKNNKKYTYKYTFEQYYPTPDWDISLQILAKDSSTGFGFDNPEKGTEDLYANVFKKYRLPTLNSDLESWTDRYEPIVKINIPIGDWKCNLPIESVSTFGLSTVLPITEGFTIDYKNKILIFNQPIWIYKVNEYGEEIARTYPSMQLYLSKKKYYDNTDDISNPLWFYTSMGTYPETITEVLELGGLGIQTGRSYKDSNGKTIRIPSWNDTAFALDYANWQLSKKCDIETNGSIEITLDTFCYFGIDLNKRIMINNILVSPLNINSITLNISSFTVNIQLTNARYYKRNVSLQFRGE